MANHLYNYSQPYTSSTLPTSFPSRGSSFTDPYLSDTSLLSSSRYLTSDPHSLPDYSRYPGTDKASLYLNQNETLRFSGTDGAGAFSGGHGVTTPSLLTHSSWTTDPALAGIKRPGEALYHQNIVGTHTSIGKSDVLFSTNPLAKRPRIESASNLPIYPQRPGEKDCAHYMLTRTCKFGDTCKFDHPLWVPECGIPDWKEVPLIATSESLPERPGEPDCPYYLKTQKCKYGFRCKFNHPKDINASATADGNTEEFADVSILPERQSEPLCTFYAKTGKCKFGAHCKFNHPKDLPIPSAVNDPTVAEQNGFAATDGTTTEAEATKKFVPFTPALLHNSKGLPIRPGEVDCPFYLKTGSCKYSATCRYNHPEWNAINPPVAVSLGLGHAMINSPAINLPLGVVNHAASILPHASLDPRLAQTTLALGPTTYPQRPGQLECDLSAPTFMEQDAFYMKTGVCKFGERCKFHHPIDRSAPTSSVVKPTLQQNVKLTLAGLPRREGEAICAYYMKTGTCKYGATCRFDHPPPGEAIALAAAQGAAVEEEKPANGAEQ